MAPTAPVPVRARIVSPVDAAIATLVIAEPPSWGNSSIADRYTGALTRPDGFVLYETAPGIQFWLGGLALFVLAFTNAFTHLWVGYRPAQMALNLLWLGWGWAFLFMFHGSRCTCKLNAEGFRLRRRLWPFYGPPTRWADCTWITAPGGRWQEVWIGRKKGRPRRFASTPTGISAFMRVATAAGLPTHESITAFVRVVGFVDGGGSRAERLGPFSRGVPGSQHLLFQLAVGATLVTAAWQVAARGSVTLQELVWALAVIVCVVFPGLQYVTLQARRAREAARAPKTIMLGTDLEITADRALQPRVIPGNEVSVLGVDWPRRDLILFLVNGKKIPLGPLPNALALNIRAWAVRNGATMALRPDYWFWKPFARRPRPSRYAALNPEGQ